VTVHHTCSQTAKKNKEKGAQKASDEGIQIDIETSRVVSVRKFYYFSTDKVSHGSSEPGARVSKRDVGIMNYEALTPVLNQSTSGQRYSRGPTE